MGLFSRKKDKGSSGQQMELHGVAGQVSTIKCLLLAGLREVSLDPTFAPAGAEVDQVNSYQYLAPFEKTPTLKHGDFTVSGARGIMTYIDIRGVGASFVPKRARTLGEQNQWIAVGFERLAPAVQEIASGSPSEAATKCCNDVLTSLDKALGNNQFVVGPLSLADPSLAAYVYVLRGCGADLSSYSNIDTWITRLEGKMSDELRSKYLPVMAAAA